MGVQPATARLGGLGVLVVGVPWQGASSTGSRTRGASIGASSVAYTLAGVHVNGLWRHTGVVASHIGRARKV